MNWVKRGRGKVPKFLALVGGFLDQKRMGKMEITKNLKWYLSNMGAF